MDASLPQSAQKVQWIDPNGQRLALEALNDGTLEVSLAYGAATLRAKNCILTEFSLPAGTPEVRKHVAQLHLTLTGTSLRVDWKEA